MVRVVGLAGTVGRSVARYADEAASAGGMLRRGGDAVFSRIRGTFGVSDELGTAIARGNTDAPRLLSAADETTDVAQSVSRGDGAVRRSSGSSSGGGGGGACSIGNSFVPGTAVLMADGTLRDVEDVELGDLVWARDPETGEVGARPVSALIEGSGDKDLVDVGVDGETITAIDGHPFWVDDEGRWVDAEDLQVGDLLLLADGTTTEVDGVWHHTQTLTVHNLTVEGIHTYHVALGDQQVLVHNASCDVARINADDLPDAERAALDDTVRNIDAGTVPTGPTAIKWDTPFGNYEGHLPADGPYREFRVAPPDGTQGAGPLRVVVEEDSGSMYYTWTHYGDSDGPALVQIR